MCPYMHGSWGDRQNRREKVRQLENEMKKGDRIPANREWEGSAHKMKIQVWLLLE